MSDLEYERATLQQLITRLSRVASHSDVGTAYRTRVTSMLDNALMLSSQLQDEIVIQRGCTLDDVHLFAYCMTALNLQSAFHAVFALDDSVSQDIAESIATISVAVESLIAESLHEDVSDIDLHALLHSMSLSRRR